MPLSRSAIVAEARTWIDTPWVHQGRSRHGIDCAGLVVRVMGDLGLPVVDRKGYKRMPQGHSFLQHIRDQTDLATTPEPGNIAIFRQPLFPCHVGFFSELHGKPHIIHSHLGTRKVMEEFFNDNWSARLVEIRSIKGLVD